MPTPDDAADALAVAICHANSMKFHHLTSGATYGFPRHSRKPRSPLPLRTFSSGSPRDPLENFTIPLTFSVY